MLRIRKKLYLCSVGLGKCNLICPFLKSDPQSRSFSRSKQYLLNFYYARHTWSTLAMNACGFDFDTVHQALNHARRGADRVTGIYVERDFTKAWEANRAVLDLLK